jgi:hypothetical protein
VFISLSIAKLNATDDDLGQIEYDWGCHIICDWTQISAQIGIPGDARQFCRWPSGVRSRFCQLINVGGSTAVNVGGNTPLTERFFSVANNVAASVAFNVIFDNTNVFSPETRAPGPDR